MNIYSANEKKKYFVYGLIATCLGREFRSVRSRVKKYSLEISEVLDGDPWMAILESQKGSYLTDIKLRELHNDYQLDPDNKKVPYYFIAKDISSKKEYVLFSNKFELIPINTKEEKENAVKIGKGLGIVEDQLDF